MENEFNTLFKGQDPSVRLFNRKIQHLPPEEAVRFYSHAYSLGLVEWEKQTTAYRHFLKRLVQHDRQRFLDFLRQNILGELCYSFADPLLATRLLALIEAGETQRPSGNHLAFSFLLGFDPFLRIETVGKSIASRFFMPEELQDIKGKAVIDTGEVNRS